MIDACFKFSSVFLRFSFRFYINVYTMYLCHSCDEKSLFFVDFLINTIKILPYNTRCRDVCTIEWILKGTRNKNCNMTRHGQQWPVNGTNVEIFSNCLCMHWNLTWIHYSHDLTIWEGFYTQIWLTHPVSSIIISSCKP